MGVGGRRGEVGKKKERVLKIGTWNKGGANKDLWKKINEIEMILIEKNLDCLGITEANLKKDAVMEKVEIPGYKMVCDGGIEHRVKKNSRVVAFVKEELSYEIVRKNMEGDLIPEIWLRLGHQGTKRTLVGFVYREHKPWKSNDTSMKGQEERLKTWLEARRQVWQGSEETYLLGDINLDWNKKGDGKYRNSKMLKKLEVELSELGWVQMVKENTHYNNSNGIISESLIDHVWTNSPVHVLKCGQEVKQASDHQLVWFERSAKSLVEKVKKTEKRVMKNFRVEDLEELCKQQDWRFEGSSERTKEMLEKRVAALETKILSILERVAPMKVKMMEYRGKPKWISRGLEARMRERKQASKKARSTRKMEDKVELRRVRNLAAKEIKEAKTEYLRKKLENLSSNSADSWAAVSEYLGWKKPLAPTQLIQDGSVLTSGPELAEAMIKQYERKEEEVQRALGEARGDYLAAGRRLTEGNKAVFSFRKITKIEVERKIEEVDNKESFGEDGISYGFLKKMAKWISPELTEIMNLSLEAKSYPASWRIARVKPLFKGEDCDRTAPKSYRPVALLSGMARIMEALLAKQLDHYQEKQGLIHQGVHGFRRGRGANTAMLEVWEYVLRRTERGELVALDFLDVSAGFDTLVHLSILRKMEVMYGMDQASLDWLSSYLEGWTQYVVVEASRSRNRNMTKGAPQGGGLSPILWRSTTNDIPEAGVIDLGQINQPYVHDRIALHQEDVGRQAVQAIEDVISAKIDQKEVEELSTEEKLDQKLRTEGTWDLQGWRRERSGVPDGEREGIRQKLEEDPEDLITTIYADDTQSRAASKTLQELEKRNGEGLTKVCKELKSLRLKVNEDKTVYMVLATQGIKRRDGPINSTIQVCGEVVNNVKTGKVLGLVVSDDMSWRDQTDKVARSCTTKLSGLWRCTSVMREDQRKAKAEGIILSRLFYCLETTSTGLKANMERLQGVQSAAARWVLQVRRRDWSLRGGLKKLGWLSVCQQAAYQSVKLAIKILQEKTPERLYKSLTHIQDGERIRKTWNHNDLMRLNLTTRKAWSTRALRWIAMMPESMLKMDLSFKSSKQSLKAWIKHRVPPRGDKVLWGKPLGVERGQRGGPGGQGGGGEGGQDSGPERDSADEASTGTWSEEGLIAPQAQQTEIVEEEGPSSERTEMQEEQLLGEGGRLQWPKRRGLQCRRHQQAGHQLCRPWRRHSPAHGIGDTTGCPRRRAARHKVIHNHYVPIVTLTLSLPRNTLGTREARPTCRGLGLELEARASWRVSGEVPRSGVG